MHENAKRRKELLDLLYQAREKRPDNGWVKAFELKNAFGDVAFSLAVLEEIGHIKSNGLCYRITGAGVLECELTVD